MLRAATILIPIFLLFTIFTCVQQFQAVQAQEVPNNRHISSWGSEISNGTQQCLTGNYMDDCWRCSPGTWDKKRKRLAGCARGYGKKAMGGREGDFYVVTDDTDDPVNPQPGTLRHAAVQDGPLWIMFARDMTIDLKNELLVSEFKTIDGRGADVHITGYGCISLYNVEHIIIHGISVHDCKQSPAGMVMVRPGKVTARGGSDGDGISLRGAKNVWIDHCSLSGCHDGLIDVVANSTLVTISNNRFRQHDKVMLLGQNDEDVIEEKKLRVTVAYNYFGENLAQRMPRCRLGQFHVVNNYYNQWQIYAIGGTASPSILSQGNLFVAPDDRYKKQVTSRINAQDWANWNWLSDGDDLLNGAFFVGSGERDIESYKPMISMKARPSSMVGLITADAGVLNCDRGTPCVHKADD